MARALFGAGCFWAVEAAFRRVPGVRDTCVGFAAAGGQQDAAARAGRVAVVRVDYDPGQLAYEALLEVFWTLHATAQPDPPPRHRSVILCCDEEQRRRAAASRAARGDRERAGAVEIAPAGAFEPADEPHQRRYEKRGAMARRLFGP